MVVISGGPSCGLGWYSLVSGGIRWFLALEWNQMFLVFALMVVVVSGGPSCGLGWYSLVSGGIRWFRTLVVRCSLVVHGFAIGCSLVAFRCSLLVVGCSMMVVH